MSGTGSDAAIKYQMSIADKIGISGTPTTLMINNDTAEYEVVA
jgi:protein-disulfide isomerase